jgi:hypothetical protein
MRRLWLPVKYGQGLPGICQEEGQPAVEKQATPVQNNNIAILKST